MTVVTGRTEVPELTSDHIPASQILPAAAEKPIERFLTVARAEDLRLVRANFLLTAVSCVSVCSIHNF